MDLLLEYSHITEWLKNTIPGIIILGGLGSIFGIFILWILPKTARFAVNTTKYFLIKIFGRCFAEFGFIYMREYYKFRSTLLQLRYKSKKTSLIILHQNISNQRIVSCLSALILFITTYFLFLITGTEYTKTAVLFVTLTIFSIHDVYYLSYLQSKIHKYIYGDELKIAENSYKDKRTVIFETTYSITNFLQEFKENRTHDKAVSNES